MPGQTRLPLEALARKAPVAPLSTTTSYEPHTTSGAPSPSRSATAGEEYQPLLQYGPAVQPPYAHLSTGAFTAARTAGRLPFMGARPAAVTTTARIRRRFVIRDPGWMKGT